MSNVFPMHRMTGTDSFNAPRQYGDIKRNGDNDHIIANAAPRIPWDVFYDRFDWKQGEHVGLIGPTGQGKTNLLMNLLPIRTYVAVFATKPRDPSMDRLMASGYYRMDKWESLDPRKTPKRVVWPNATHIDAEDTQREVFDDAFKAIYKETGWCIDLDEGYYISQTLGLQKRMRTIWTQGRSLGISFVVSTQRPKWVPLEMYDQSTHLFFWRENDDDNLRRIAGMGAAPSVLIREIVSNLDPFQCLYVNTRNGSMMRTRAPAPLNDSQ